MNLLFGQAKYADIVERCMYNGALAGISLSGDRFFYVNPLASTGDHHRVAWFHTSCCPTNLVRFLPSIGGYQYAVAGQGMAVNQYIGGEAEITLAGGSRVSVLMDTEYPRTGDVRLDIRPEREETFPVRLRIPGWCRSFRASINGETLPLSQTVPADGYLVLERRWSHGDRVELVLDMPVQAVRSHPKVAANEGRVALQRGPLVYCLEQADNAELAYDQFQIDPEQSFAAEYRAELLGGVTVIAGDTASAGKCTFIPYYAWDNREPGFMQVWVKEERTERLYR
jgi:DUF1680 family protein